MRLRVTIVGERFEVEEVTPACPWVAEAICAPVSCGVTPDVEHALHRYAGKHHLESTLCTCVSDYSQKADSFDVSVVKCRPITYAFLSSSGDLPTPPVIWGLTNH